MVNLIALLLADLQIYIKGAGRRRTICEPTAALPIGLKCLYHRVSLDA